MPPSLFLCRRRSAATVSPSQPHCPTHRQCPSLSPATPPAPADTRPPRPQCAHANATARVRQPRHRHRPTPPSPPPATLAVWPPGRLAFAMFTWQVHLPHGRSPMCTLHTQCAHGKGSQPGPRLGLGLVWAGPRLGGDGPGRNLRALRGSIGTLVEKAAHGGSDSWGFRATTCARWKTRPLLTGDTATAGCDGSLN